MKIVNRSSFVLGIIAVIVGLLGFSPAQADGGSSSDFTSSWNASASANAEASGVAYAGANAKGKILLQEVRATMTALEQGKFSVPTKADIDKYGTVVHSTAEANAVLAKEIPVYDKIVNKASAKVAKLKLKVKHASSPAEKRALKKKLKKAQKRLNVIMTDKDWKYRPLLVLPRGVCFRNTGANDHMNLTSFVECVGGSDASIELGFDPAVRDMRVVAKVKTDGSVVPGCLNFSFFDIPPGTPDQSLFIIVKTFVGVTLQVAVSVHVVGDLTVYGTLTVNGLVCDTETKVQHVDQYVALPNVTFSGHDSAEAMAFGVHQAQTSASVMASAQGSVQASVQTSVSLTMHLECAASGSVAIDEMNDLDQSTINPNSGEVIESWTTTDVDYSTAAGQTAQLVLDCTTCGRVTFPNGQSTMQVTGDGNQHSVTVTYVAGTESGTDTVTIEMRINGQPVDSDFTNVTINPTPVIPLRPAA